MKHIASSSPLFWKMPLRGNADRAIALSFEEFALRKGGGPYSLGEALEFVARRAPALRAKLARAHSHKGSAAAAA